MSLFGSLFTGVSALNTQSQAMGTLSNNIANVNTVGYKRINASFSSLVTSQSSSGRYAPGSVSAVTNNTVDQQGAIQQTSSQTDIALAGNGMFVIQRDGDDGFQETLYTRSGSFKEDASGVLRNTAGFFLMGWPLDANGELPAAQADISSLAPVDVAFLGGLTSPTSRGSISLNLDAAEVDTNFPVNPVASPDFTRGLRVFDSLGEGQDIEFRFFKHASPTASSTSAVGGTGLAIDTTLAGIADVDVGEEIVVTVGAFNATFTVAADSTTQDFIDFVNNDINLGANSLATLTSNGQVQIIANNLADAVTVANGAVGAGAGAATALGFTNTAAPAAPNIFPGGLAQLENVPNPRGWWQLELTDANSGAQLGIGSINFNSDGSLNAAEDPDNDIKITLNNINWGNGSADQDIELDIRNLTQFSGEYNIISSSQNGAELGLRTGVEIDRDGIVSARFSNGKTQQLYKLPVATFTNINGLEEQSGNAYIESSESGSFNLREAGTGGAGLVNGSSLESSNVDLADEFSRMIIVQRAYSAGTKVISTADEMTEELLRLR